MTAIKEITEHLIAINNIRNKYGMGSIYNSMLKSDTPDIKEVVFLICKYYSDKGDIDSKIQLSHMYAYGIGIDKNINEAIKIIEEVDVNDDIQYIKKYADYLMERNKNDDAKIVLSLLKEHYEKDRIGFGIRLSRVYRKGIGVDKNLDTSLKYLEEGIKKHHPLAIKDALDILAMKPDFDMAKIIMDENFLNHTTIICNHIISLAKNDKIGYEEINTYLSKLEKQIITNQSNIELYIKLITSTLKECKEEYNAAYEQLVKRRVTSIINPMSYELILEYLSDKVPLAKDDLFYYRQSYNRWRGGEIHENPVSYYNNQQYINSRYGMISSFFEPAQPLKSLGWNTGNLAFLSSIKKLFRPDVVPIQYSNKLNNYDSVIYPGMIWIRENSDFNYFLKIVEKTKTPIVPMSVGLQSSTNNPEFKLHNSVVDSLKIIQKRSIIGVRGKYTQEILQNYGIDNTMVIGCPSMYYWNNPHFKIKDKPTDAIQMISNFKTFSTPLDEKMTNILKYLIDNSNIFIEQTAEKVNNKLYLTDFNDSLIYDIGIKRKLFYTNEDWLEGIHGNDFSMGLRFHGNVMALRAGFKSLFITLDSRTREMTSFFNLPNMDYNDFDTSMTVEDYYKMADYTSFNKKYPSLFNIFLKFLKENGMEIQDGKE